MLSKNPDISIETPRRSSVSSSCPSSCPSSSGLSFASTDSSDSFTTPSPYMPMQIDMMYGSFPLGMGMEEYTKGTLAAVDGYFPFSSPQLAPSMDLAYRNTSISGFEFPDYSLNPIHTMVTTSSPTNDMSAYDYTFDGIKTDPLFEAEGFLPTSVPKQEADVKMEQRDRLAMKKKVKQRTKCRGDNYPLTVKPGQFKCDFPGCPTQKAFVRQEHLKRHQRIHDKNKNVVKCRLCEKAFSRQDNCRDHEKRHKNPGTPSGKSTKRVKFDPRAETMLAGDEAKRHRPMPGSSKAKAAAVRAVDKMSRL